MVLTKISRYYRVSSVEIISPVKVRHLGGMKSKPLAVNLVVSLSSNVLNIIPHSHNRLDKVDTASSI